MRLIAEFRKEGPARYISHLDLMRTVQRSLRRASLPVAYSQGFNPHALVSFATAVPVGCSSQCEVMDATMEEEVAPLSFLSSLNAALPAGLIVARALIAPESAPAPMAAVEAARYRVLAVADAQALIDRFLARDAFLAVKAGKKGKREVDIRPMVFALAQERPGEVTCTLRHDNALALKPSLLMDALGIETSGIHRTALLVRNGEGFAPLYDWYEGRQP